MSQCHCCHSCCRQIRCCPVSTASTPQSNQESPNSTIDDIQKKLAILSSKFEAFLIRQNPDQKPPSKPTVNVTPPSPSQEPPDKPDHIFVVQADVHVSPSNVQNLDSQSSTKTQANVQNMSISSVEEFLPEPDLNCQLPTNQLT